MNNKIYKKSFDLFLNRTDEKSIIKKFIHDNIPIHKKMNFLDIGGGDGSLASIISKQVKTTYIVEPNKYFYKQLLKQKKNKILNKRWEDVFLNKKFDFILAAYVVTYFPQIKRDYLIKKMYDLLQPGGYILILSVDAKKGSWRKIHTYFYKLIKFEHKSSDNFLKKSMRKYKAISKSFKTRIIAKNTNEMLDILKFDFYKYPKELSKFSEHLIRFLRKKSDKTGKTTLEIIHNAYIITKK